MKKGLCANDEDVKDDFMTIWNYLWNKQFNGAI